MTDEVLGKAAALRKITTDGLDSTLRPAGFEVTGRYSWTRQTIELHHVIELLSRRGRFDIQWGVISPECTPFLWGNDSPVEDVGAAVMSGTPGTIRSPPNCQSFRLDPPVSLIECERTVAVAADAQIVAQRLAAFQTRRDLREYLLLNRGLKDRRDFVIPANLPLKLFTAAVLAVIDTDPVARSLATEAETLMAPYKEKLSIDRVLRLREGVQLLDEA